MYTDVSTENSISFYLARDTKPNGDFCCYPGFHVTSQECITSAGGPPEPFEIPAGTVIVDRSSGATLTYNSTSGTNTTIIATVTRRASSESDGNMTAVAVGIAVPLGVTFSRGTGWLWFPLSHSAQRETGTNDERKIRTGGAVVRAAQHEGLYAITKQRAFKRP